MDSGWAWRGAVVDLLEVTRLAQPDELPAAVNRAAARLGVDISMYLVDLEQRTLRPVPEAGKPMPEPLPVDTTLAGRAFMAVRPVVARGTPGCPDRLWMPLVDGSERLGVLDIVTTDPVLLGEGEARPAFEMFAALVGHLVAVKVPYGDRLAMVRRSRRMSEASELLWTLLPPLTYAGERLAISAVLEPCYDVGGDGFDYAVDGAQAYVAIFDTVGHGLRAGLGTTVVLAATRAARRDGDGLYAIARAADRALAEHGPAAPGGDLGFTTGVLCQLDLDTGLLRYLNAGHPQPLLLRRGRVVRRLGRGRRLPLGLDDPQIEIAEEILEPGDRVLLHTDGVTEAPDPAGEPFGEARLADLVERHEAAGLPAPETLRRVCHAALDSYDGPPADDATLVLVEWSRRLAERAVP